MSVDLQSIKDSLTYFFAFILGLFGASPNYIADFALIMLFVLTFKKYKLQGIIYSLLIILYALIYTVFSYYHGFKNINGCIYLFCFYVILFFAGLSFRSSSKEKYVSTVKLQRFLFVFILGVSIFFIRSFYNTDPEVVFFERMIINCWNGSGINATAFAPMGNLSFLFIPIMLFSRLNLFFVLLMIGLIISNLGINFLLGNRGPILILGILLLLCFYIKRISLVKKIGYAVVFSTIIGASLFYFYDIIEQSPTFQRIYNNGFDTPRFEYYGYVDDLFKYSMLGGGEVNKMHEITYFHNTILDAFNEVGILGAIIILLIVIVNGIDVLRGILKKSNNFDFVIGISISVILMITLVAEPLTSAPTIILSTYFFGCALLKNALAKT